MKYSWCQKEPEGVTDAPITQKLCGFPKLLSHTSKAKTQIQRTNSNYEGCQVLYTIMKKIKFRVLKYLLSLLSLRTKIDREIEIYIFRFENKCLKKNSNSELHTPRQSLQYVFIVCVYLFLLLLSSWFSLFRRSSASKGKKRENT